MRLFYRDWRPTRLGRWVNRISGWWSGFGLPPKFQAVLEVPGRTSGRRRSNPVVIATVEGRRYLVSMLGPESDWVKNVEAAHGDAVICQGRRRRVHLAAVPPEQRAPILSRVRTDRAQRPTALSALRRCAAVRLRGDRGRLSCVSNRSLIKPSQTTVDYLPKVVRRLTAFTEYPGWITSKQQVIPQSASSQQGSDASDAKPAH
jgi:F420H(2)-dependent quinone reductase